MATRLTTNPGTLRHCRCCEREYYERAQLYEAHVSRPSPRLARHFEYKGTDVSAIIRKENAKVGCDRAPKNRIV